MIVEIVKTLKGSRVWKKGMVLTSPLPAEILKEVEKRSPCVRVTEDPTEAENPIAEVEMENEKEFEYESSFPIDQTEEDQEPEPEEQEPEEPEEPEIPDLCCPACGWVGKTPASLKRHITMNHM
jgi:hypothetical protein